ncbi:hypothetical protein EJ110_NYTH58816 [Nymphaea thermarum]|nr:hypothetical protein EJ110_NYTH58816 [Nymphaea thermarum]
MSIIPSFFGRRSNVSDPERTSIIPSFFGRRSNVSDPFPLGVWDPFEGSAFVSTKIDWKETPEALFADATSNIDGNAERTEKVQRVRKDGERSSFVDK